MSPTSPLGEFEHVVLLAILRLADEASGVAVARELESTAGRRVSRGALYTTLDRLEQKGLLRWKVASGGPARDGAPRRVYTVTAAGMAALRDSRRVLKRLWRGLEHTLEERP